MCKQNVPTTKEAIDELACTLSQDAMEEISTLIHQALPRILRKLSRVGFEECAENYPELTGGAIRNAAITAVSLAMDGYSQIILDSEWKDLV